MTKHKLHKYTLSEELISAISHGVGAILALVGSILLIIRAFEFQADTLSLISVFIYCFSMISLYTVSTVYHSLAPNAAKKVLRVLDHCFVFILIIGTYAPFTLAAIRGVSGIAIFLVVLISGILGIVLTSVNMKKFSKFCFVCYLVMGWSIIFAIKPLVDTFDSGSLFFLVAGGVVYTIGALLYLAGKKKKYIHSLWHFFVLGGTVLHFIPIYNIFA